LINTHWHFDHTGGNEWVQSIDSLTTCADEAGASILAHENTRKHLSQATRVEGNFRYTFPAATAGAIPSTVFKDEHTLHANNTTLMLKHYQPAHTDSDISVHFVEADILHTGDTFWNRDYPFIDYWTGGSIDGQIRAAEANIAKVTDKTIVIPGHGAVGNKPTWFYSVTCWLGSATRLLPSKNRVSPCLKLSLRSLERDMTRYGATCSRTRVTLLRSCNRAFETI
jgi:glyoxylase-like metal-dependent hydrolase (beta-lactamase superfamily II)